MAPPTGEIAAPRKGSRFPLALAVTVILLTGVPLLLVGGNISWNSAADASAEAWSWANIALALGWLVAWPAAALPPRPRRPTRVRVLLEILTIVAAAVPALAVAFALSAPGRQAVVKAVAVQGALALLAAGCVTWRARRGGALLGALLIALALALPIAGYLGAEFYPASGSAWHAFIPLVAVAHAAEGVTTESFRWMVLLFAAVGAALLTAGPGKPQGGGRVPVS